MKTTVISLRLGLLFIATALIIAGAGGVLFLLRPKPPVPVALPSVTTAPTSGTIQHVVVILEENKPASSIMSNAAAPFINQLAASGAQAEDYSAVTHPSLPNYIALTSGTTAGITNDCNPPGGTCSANVTNIADRLEKAGKSWKEYAESMPQPCYTLNSGDYAVKHNPFLYYPDIRNDAARCDAHDVPFSQLAGDLASGHLPAYSFITPNLCNDMHNCGVSTGDAWLAREVPSILRSSAFTTQRSLLIITWDEGYITDNTVPTIFAGSGAKAGFVSDAAYGHYALLHTIEHIFNLQPLTTNDASAPVMSDMLR